MQRMENVYIMTAANGELITHTPLSPAEVNAMKGEVGVQARAEMGMFLKENPGVSFTQDPDYELEAVYYYPDGTVDMIARYLGPGCGHEGCKCEEMPFQYFGNGNSLHPLDEDGVKILSLILKAAGAEKVSLDF